MGAHSKQDDILYWACPHGCVKIAISGSATRALMPILDLLGIVQLDASMVPSGWLEQAEAAVERHEFAAHFVGGVAQ